MSGRSIIACAHHHHGTAGEQPGTMGQSLTRDQRSYMEALQKVLKTHGFQNVAQHSLMTLLVWTRDNCPWFPQEGTLSVAVGEQVGDELRRQRDDKAKKLLVTWQQVFFALLRLFSIIPGPDSECDDAFISGLNDLEQEADLHPPPNMHYCAQPTASPGPPPTWDRLPRGCPSLGPSVGLMPALPQCCGALELCREEALRRGDLDILHAFPVRYQAGQPTAWEQLPYEAVKGVRKSVKDYGLQSAYTMNLFQAVAEGYTMTPHDWKTLCRLTLTAMQYTVWLTEYRDRATVQTMSNLNNMANIGIEELMGEGRYATAIAQVQLPQEALEQASLLALQALRKVPAGMPAQSFATVRQGPQEPYIQFLDRLQNAIHQQIESEEAQRLLLMQLAMENANADCQKALRPLRSANLSLADMIRACQNVGMESHRADLLAAALLQQMVVTAVPGAPCFNCGQSGHFKRDCKFGGGGGKKSGRRSPSRPCQQCQCRLNPDYRHQSAASPHGSMGPARWRPQRSFAWSLICYLYGTFCSSRSYRL
uniref:Gag polyprotein n=1 Tax=Dromaius novaehollandiae TaxID=8790 RepID=A0A8C4JZ42_DRONO